MGVASSRSCDLDRLSPDARRPVFSVSLQVLFQCTLSHSRENLLGVSVQVLTQSGLYSHRNIHGTLKFQLAAQLICVFISQYAKAGFLMMCPIIRVEPSYDFKKFCHVQSGSKLFANGKNRR